MKNKGKHIDDLFKDGLGDYTELPPPASWDRLEKKLDGIQTRKPGQYYRWLGYFAMVSLLLLLGVSVARNIAGNSSYTGRDIAINKIATTGIQPGTATKTTTAPSITATGTAANNNEKNAPGNNDNGQNNTPGTTGTQTGNKPAPMVAGANKTIQNKTARLANANKARNKYAATRSINRNRKGKPVTEAETGEQDDNLYNSSAARTAIKPGPQNPEEQPADKNKTSELAAVAPKKPAPKPVAKIDVKQAPKQKPPRPYFPRFEAGVKAGYETGFNNDAAKKAVVSPYLQYNITPKWSVMLQPAIKAAVLNSRLIGTPQSYYKVNADGKITQNDSSIIRISDGVSTGFVDSFRQRDYIYTQSHDSIVKISSIGGTYAEFEVPILLKYNISKKFSVYGGVNIIYSRLISVTENTTTSQPITKSVPEKTIGSYFGAAPAIPKLDSVITYSGTPISNYTGPQYPATQSSQLRFGYMLGFSYEYDKRWLFDALVQQGSVNANVLGGYNINSALSSAYLRLTIGYKIIK